MTAPTLQVRPSEEQVEEWRWQGIHFLFWFAAYEEARQDCVPEGSLNWKDEYGPIVDELLLKLDLMNKDTVDGSLDDHSTEEVEQIIAYARQITDDIAYRCEFTPLPTVTPTPDPADAPAAAEIVAGSRYLRFRENLSKSAHDLFDEFLIRLIEGDRRVDADTLVAVRVKGNSEYIAEMEEFLDEYGAEAIEGLDGPEVLICIRVSYLPRMTGEWFVGLIAASGLVPASDAENCDDVDWVEDPFFVPRPDDDVVLAVPTPAGNLDEEALFEAEIKWVIAEGGNDPSDEEVQEVKNALRELYIDLEDLKRFPGVKIIEDGLRRTAHLWKRPNLDPDSARVLSGHLAFRMEGVRGKHSPIAVGVRITSDDSSEENLTRFIQQDEVHVLTPADGYDAALCVSRARMFELADVPGIEYIDRLAYPLWSDKVRAKDPAPTSTTDDEHEDIRQCSSYVFFIPR